MGIVNTLSLQQSQTLQSILKNYRTQFLPNLINKKTQKAYILHQVSCGSQIQRQLIQENIRLYQENTCQSITKLQQYFKSKDNNYCSNRDNYFLIFNGHQNNTIRHQYQRRAAMGQNFTQEEIIIILESIICGLRQYHLKFQRSYDNFSFDDVIIQEGTNRLYLKDPWLSNNGNQNNKGFYQNNNKKNTNMTLTNLYNSQNIQKSIVFGNQRIQQDYLKQISASQSQSRSPFHMNKSISISNFQLQQKSSTMKQSFVINSYFSPQKLTALYHNKFQVFDQLQSDLFITGIYALQLYHMQPMNQIYLKNHTINFGLLNSYLKKIGCINKGNNISSQSSLRLKNGIQTLLQTNPNTRSNIFQEWNIRCPVLRSLNKNLQRNLKNVENMRSITESIIVNNNNQSPHSFFSKFKFSKTGNTNLETEKSNNNNIEIGYQNYNNPSTIFQKSSIQNHISNEKRYKTVHFQKSIQKILPKQKQIRQTLNPNMKMYDLVQDSLKTKSNKEIQIASTLISKYDSRWDSRVQPLLSNKNNNTNKSQKFQVKNHSQQILPFYKRSINNNNNQYSQYDRLLNINTNSKQKYYNPITQIPKSFSQNKNYISTSVTNLNQTNQSSRYNLNQTYNHHNNNLNNLDSIFQKNNSYKQKQIKTTKNINDFNLNHKNQNQNQNQNFNIPSYFTTSHKNSYINLRNNFNYVINLHNNVNQINNSMNSILNKSQSSFKNNLNHNYVNGTQKIVFTNGNNSKNNKSFDFSQSNIKNNNNNQNNYSSLNHRPLFFIQNNINLKKDQSIQKRQISYNNLFSKSNSIEKPVDNLFLKKPAFFNTTPTINLDKNYQQKTMKKQQQYFSITNFNLDNFNINQDQKNIKQIYNSSPTKNIYTFFDKKAYQKSKKQRKEFKLSKQKTFSQPKQQSTPIQNLNYSLLLTHNTKNNNSPVNTITKEFNYKTQQGNNCNYSYSPKQFIININQNREQKIKQMDDCNQNQIQKQKQKNNDKQKQMLTLSNTFNNQKNLDLDSIKQTLSNNQSEVIMDTSNFHQKIHKNENENNNLNLNSTNDYIQKNINSRSRTEQIQKIQNQSFQVKPSSPQIDNNINNNYTTNNLIKEYQESFYNHQNLNKKQYLSLSSSQSQSYLKNKSRINYLNHLNYINNYSNSNSIKHSHQHLNKNRNSNLIIIQQSIRDINNDNKSNNNDIVVFNRLSNKNQKSTQKQKIELKQQPVIQQLQKMRQQLLEMQIQLQKSKKLQNSKPLNQLNQKQFSQQQQLYKQSNKDNVNAINAINPINAINANHFSVSQRQTNNLKNQGYIDKNNKSKISHGKSFSNSTSVFNMSSQIQYSNTIKNNDHNHNQSQSQSQSNQFLQSFLISNSQQNNQKSHKNKLQNNINKFHHFIPPNNIQTQFLQKQKISFVQSQNLTVSPTSNQNQNSNQNSNATCIQIPDQEKNIIISNITNMQYEQQQQNIKQQNHFDEINIKNVNQKQLNKQKQQKYQNQQYLSMLNSDSLQDINNSNCFQKRFSNTIVQEIDQSTPSVSQKDQSQSSQGQQQYVIQQYQTGSKYQGYKKNGMRNGQGKFFYQDGGHYQGQWKQNKMHGWGKLFYQGGRLAYQGNWKQDQFHGFGKVYNDNPIILNRPFDYTNFDLLQDYWVYYQGSLVTDTKQGRGKIKLTNGQSFEGDFHVDRIQGFGKYKTKQGSVIQGIWRDSRLMKIIS